MSTKKKNEKIYVQPGDVEIDHKGRLIITCRKASRVLRKHLEKFPKGGQSLEDLKNPIMVGCTKPTGVPEEIKPPLELCSCGPDQLARYRELLDRS